MREPLTQQLLSMVFLSEPHLHHRLPSGPTVFFANHSSHLDTVALWLSLPHELRRQTRPVAASDYWSTGAKAKLIRVLLNPILIERKKVSVEANPISQIIAARRPNDNLILFPEGTRNTGDHDLLPFKAGIWHLGRQAPDFAFVPVYLHNLSLMLPKNSILYVPFAAHVHFGQAVPWHANKIGFLAECRNAVLSLKAHATHC